MNERSELADALDDFAGLEWIPGLAQVLDGLAAMDEAAQTGRLTPDATQTLLAVIANPDSPDLAGLLALAVKSITGPGNPALDQLDDDTRKTVQHLGELHAHDTAQYAAREYTNEAAGLIYEATFNPTT